MNLSKLFSKWLDAWASLAEFCSKKPNKELIMETENTTVVDPYEQARVELENFIAGRDAFLQAKLREGASPQSANQQFDEQVSVRAARVLGAWKEKHSPQPSRSVLVFGQREPRNPCLERILK